MKRSIAGRETLSIILQRVKTLEEKLLRGESLSEKEDEDLALHLGIPKFRDNQDRLQRIKEFCFSAKKSDEWLKEEEEKERRKKK